MICNQFGATILCRLIEQHPKHLIGDCILPRSQLIEECCRNEYAANVVECCLQHASADLLCAFYDSLLRTRLVRMPGQPRLQPNGRRADSRSYEEPAHLLRRLIGSETGCWVVQRMIDYCPVEMLGPFSSAVQESLRQMGSWANANSDLPAIQLLRQKFQEELAQFASDNFTASSMSSSSWKQMQRINENNGGEATVIESWGLEDLKDLAISEFGTKKPAVAKSDNRYLNDDGGDNNNMQSNAEYYKDNSYQAANDGAVYDTLPPVQLSWGPQEYYNDYKRDPQTIHRVEQEEYSAFSYFPRHQQRLQSMDRYNHRQHQSSVHRSQSVERLHNVQQSRPLTYLETLQQPDIISWGSVIADGIPNVTNNNKSRKQNLYGQRRNQELPIFHFPLQ
jgi:hypothetical protein